MLQTMWHHLTGCTSAAPAAISSHTDGRLYVVAVRSDGEVVSTFIRRDADGWAPWAVVNAGSTVLPGAATSTPPVLLSGAGGLLYLFCRGVDHNLYVTSRHGAGDWIAWHQVTTDGSVLGWFGVTLTEDPWFAHVIHEGHTQHAEYRRFDSSWSLDSASAWPDVREAEIASDGTGEVLVALRSTADRLSLVRQHFPWGSSWRPVENEHGAAFDQPCSALSNVVEYAGGFHLLYATSAMLDDIGGSVTHQLAHTRVPAYQYDDGFFRTVRSYGSAAGRDPQPALATYRGKLVAAFADENTDIRAAWLDTADPGSPWVGGEVVAGGGSRDRPRLAAMDGWAPLSDPDRLARNFGNDLFAVVTGLTGGSVWVANLSRALLVDQLASVGHRVDWCTNLPGTCPDCTPQAGLPPTTEVPEFTEIGYGSMTLPQRIMRPAFPRVMQFEGAPGADYMAWVHTTELATLGKGPYIGPHLNVDHTLTHTAWQHEALHRIATSMALWDDDNPAHHPNPNLMDDLFPQYLVQQATTLFREETDKTLACGLGADGTRCRGFVRTDPVGSPGEKYDVGSCQHSFIELVQLYLADGQRLRRMVVDDQRHGVTLLRRKYEWVRRFVFGGVEFGAHGVPIHPVHIVNRNSKKALDVASWSLDDHADVQQYELHRGDNQRWLLVPQEHGYHQLVAMHSGLALDVAGVSLDDGASVQQYAPHGGHNQQWRLVPDGDGGFEIVARHSDKCLEVVGWSMDDHARVGQYHRHGGDNQKWMLEPA